MKDEEVRYDREVTGDCEGFVLYTWKIIEVHMKVSYIDAPVP